MHDQHEARQRDQRVEPAIGQGTEPRHQRVARIAEHGERMGGEEQQEACDQFEHGETLDTAKLNILAISSRAVRPPP